MQFKSFIRAATSVAAALSLTGFATTAHAASPPMSPSAVSPSVNSRGYHALDTSHAITTTLGTVPVQSSSVPLLYWFPVPGRANMWDPMGAPSTGSQPFSADFGYGNDISNAREFFWDTTSGPLLNAVTSIEFEGPDAAVFMHLAGYYEAGAANVVMATVPITVPTGAKYSAGAVVLALQTQDSSGIWHDVATSNSTAMTGPAASTLTTSAGIPGLTFVRLEVRSGNAATANGFSVGFASLTVPECVPDPTNPGACISGSSTPSQAPQCAYYATSSFAGNFVSVYCPEIPKGASINIFELGSEGWVSLATYPTGVPAGYVYNLLEAPVGTMETLAACVETSTNNETPGPGSWGCDLPSVLTIPALSW